MDNHQASVPTFRLKVNLRCCAACPEKAEKKLNRIHGVKSVSINKEEGIVIVSGNVDPKIFIDKFAKWGRKTQLLSFQNDSSTSDQHLRVDNDFDSDDDDGGCCHCEANENQSGSESCQNPILKDKPSEKPNIIASSKTKKGKFAWFWNLFRRKKKLQSSTSEFSRVKSPTTAKRSGTDMDRYPRPRWPNNRSPFDDRPNYGIPGSYNLPYSYQRIMPLCSRPPPYGIYGSMAARNDPQIIHYPNYRDNYFPNPMYYS